MKKVLWLLMTLFFITGAGKAQSDKYKTVYSQSFSNEKSIEDFEFSDTGKWIISKNGKSGKSLKCTGQGQYNHALGGPSVVAVLKGFELSDFVLEMDVQHNGKDYNSLDFCLLFSITGEHHYTFAHISSKADKDNHNIYELNGGEPHRIGTKHNDGVLWGIDQWHHIRLERKQSDRSVKVYFNDELILEARDEAFKAGLVGFGSENSALKVDNIKVSAPQYSTSSTELFK